MTDQLSPAEARRVALAAQGFSNSRRRRTRRPFDHALEHMHILQIDSVRVFERSHYLPVFSRHGPYELETLDEHLWCSGEYTEYWAHEAAFIPVADRPLFAWRMDDFRERFRRNGRAEALAPTIERVRKALAGDGPRLVRELEKEPRGGRGPWWDWSDTKRAVEILFAQGEVVSAGREAFQRRYALAEETLASEALVPVAREVAQRALVERAAGSLGIGTLADLADYYRLKAADARVAVEALEEAGTLIRVHVAGWARGNGTPEPAWLHRDARVPSRLAPDALLTPFDPVVWYRPRTERIFDFHYRLEIYTPKEKRLFGYYCLPLMVGGRLAGRIDLKADRRARVLRVQAAWKEHRAPSRTAETAIRLLTEAARWQGLETITWSGAGNLTLPEAWSVTDAESDSIHRR